MKGEINITVYTFWFCVRYGGLPRTARMRLWPGSAHLEALWLGSQCSWLMPLLPWRVPICSASRPGAACLALTQSLLLSCPPRKHETPFLASQSPSRCDICLSCDTHMQFTWLGTTENMIQGWQKAGHRGAYPGRMPAMRRCGRPPWASTSRYHRSAALLCAPLAGTPPAQCKAIG